MSRLKDLKNQRFGKLVVIEFSESKNRKTKWLCKCDCGNVIAVRSDCLNSGHTTSCGCYRKEISKERPVTHNGSKSRLYKTWLSMKSRCLNKNDADFKSYGGRGIKVCDDWKENYTSFSTWAINNGYSDNLTIDRIDVNGNYDPNNCRWADAKQQANNRTNNHYITFNGKTQTISQWEADIGVKPYNLYNRINNLNWSIERALSERG